MPQNGLFLTIDKAWNNERSSHPVVTTQIKLNIQINGFLNVFILQYLSYSDLKHYPKRFFIHFFEFECVETQGNILKQKNMQIYSLKHPKGGFIFIKNAPKLVCAFKRLLRRLVLSFNTIHYVVYPVRSQTQRNIFAICANMSWSENGLLYKYIRKIGLK